MNIQDVSINGKFLRVLRNKSLNRKFVEYLGYDNS